MMPTCPSLETVRRLRRHVLRMFALLLALVGGSAGLSVYAPAVFGQPTALQAAPAARAQPPGAPAMWTGVLNCADRAPHGSAAPFIRTELFFGTQKPNGTEVTEAEFQRFVDQEITPRFPEGLTLLTGYGQFRNSTGQIIQETSKLLILLYPLADGADKSAKIEQIRTVYEQQFQQESVLRSDDRLPVCVSF
jgi:hypothetical protein